MLINGIFIGIFKFRMAKRPDRIYLFIFFLIFFSAFFFAGTVATTIGYGNMVPQSTLGKAASLVFMIVGIPYFALMTTFISANINLLFNKLRKGFNTSKGYTNS